MRFSINYKEVQGTLLHIENQPVMYRSAQRVKNIHDKGVQVPDLLVNPSTGWVSLYNHHGKVNGTRGAVGHKEVLERTPGFSIDNKDVQGSGPNLKESQSAGWRSLLSKGKRTINTAGEETSDAKVCCNATRFTLNDAHSGGSRVKWTWGTHLWGWASPFWKGSQDDKPGAVGANVEATYVDKMCGGVRWHRS